MADESTALVPVEEKAVEFYDDEIVAVAVQEEGVRRIYVPLKPISDYLGLSWSGQSERVRRDPVLFEEMKLIRVTRINSEGGRPDTLCLPIEFLHGWLFGISVNRVKEELREKIIRYQRECYQVLYDAFQERSLTSDTSSALEHVRNIGIALQRLAEEQMQLEGRVTTTEDRLDRAALIVGELGRRVGQLEGRASPAALVTEEQAGEIAALVKALAQLLTEQDASKNHFAGVYSELYRRFGVSSYKNIRQTRYAEVLDFLEEWRTRLAGE